LVNVMWPRRYLTGLVFSLLLCAPVQSESLPSREEFDHVVSLQLQDESFLARQNPFLPGTEAHLFARDFTVTLWSTPQFRAFMYRKLVENHGRIDDSSLLVYALTKDLVQDGLRRLDDQELEQYFKLLYVMMLVAGEKDCARLGMGGAGQDAAVLSTLATMPRKSLDRYFKISYRAVVASLDGEREGATEIDPTTQRLITNALIKGMAQKVRGSDIERLGSVLETPSLASEKDLCWYSRLSYDVALSLPPDIRRWTLRWIMSKK